MVIVQLHLGVALVLSFSMSIEYLHYDDNTIAPKSSAALIIFQCLGIAYAPVRLEL